MIRFWLRRWLGIIGTYEDCIRWLDGLQNRIEELEQNALLPTNYQTHQIHIENSLRLLEARIKQMEALELADGTVGEHAARKAMRDQEDKQLRLDQSAAKVRGMSLDEYKAGVARRKAEKAKESARETIEGEAT
jgi:hypothetical protein